MNTVSVNLETILPGMVIKIIRLDSNDFVMNEDAFFKESYNIARVLRFLKFCFK